MGKSCRKIGFCLFFCFENMLGFGKKNKNIKKAFIFENYCSIIITIRTWEEENIMSEFTKTLNPMQQKAVMHTEGPLLVLAGAGSGKTTVLVNRVAHILKDLQVPPYRVLAITFTNKAANEMKTRIENIFGGAVKDMWISTFHSMCVKILRRYISRIGYDSSFAIYDTADALTLMKECLKEADLSDKNFPPKTVLAEIGRAKDEMQTPEDYEQINSSNFRLTNIAKLYKIYQRKLKENNALDFDDIIFKTVVLLEKNADILEYYQKKFKYIMVDEYQDTNNVQYRLVSLLAEKHRNLCVVGDDDQSIYKFRGANVGNILNFEDDFKNAEVIKLEQNYRSTKNILDAANAVIKNNTERKAKQLWTQGDTGENIFVYNSENEHDEGNYIACEIDRKVSEFDYNFSDFAILYRTNAQSRVLEDMLLRKGIPYKVLAGMRFYDRKEIKDVLAYLRFINNPADAVSLKRIINEPKRGIGQTTMAKAEALALKHNISLYDVLKKSDCYEETLRSSAKILEFVNMAENFMAKKDKVDLCDFVEEVMEKSGYRRALVSENSIEAQSRLENLDEFISVAKEYVNTQEDASFSGFLESVALVADIDGYDEDQPSVVLMTIHSAKGLEFPVVFIAGLDEGIFPSSRSMMSEDDIEEERRLCYVAITRAKKQLYITHAQQRMLFGSTQYYAPSRFLVEIPKDLKVEFGKKKSVKSEFAGEFKEFAKGFFERETKRDDEKKKADISRGSRSSLFDKFDMRSAKKEVDLDFKPGDKVSHKKFGNGVIKEVAELGNDKKLTIEFEQAGVKNLMAMFANLKKER